MDQDLTELVFILDRSGSMHGMEKDTIGGFNSMIEKQRACEGRAFVSTVLFNESQEVVHNRVDLSSVPEMDETVYSVFGCTALLDAVGNAIEHIYWEQRRAPESERPGHTVFVIITDGLENASRKYGYEKISLMIDARKECGWEFLFIGANIDAVKEASRIGIDRNRSVEFKCDSEGIDVVYESVGDVLCCPRMDCEISDSWSDRIRNDLESRGGRKNVEDGEAF